MGSHGGRRTLALGASLLMLVSVVVLLPRAAAGPPGTPTTLATVTDLRFWDVTADGTTVVFQDGESLYRVPTTGGAVTELTRSLPAGATVHDPEMLPDSATVIFWVDDDTAGEVSLQRVATGGGAPVEIVSRSDWTTPPTGYQVLSADGSRLITIPTEGTDSGQLVSIPTGGGPTVAITTIGALTGSGKPVISPNSARVLFQTGSFDFFTVPTDGSEPEIQLSDVGGLHGHGFHGQFTPDSTTVVYRAFADSGVFSSRELFSVNAAGGAVTQLTSGGDARRGAVDHVEFDGSSSTVVYLYLTTDGADIYSVPVSGGTPTQLNLPAVGNANFSFPVVAGTHVVFTGPQDALGLRQLYRVPIGGGTPTRLNDAITNGSIHSVSVNPTGTHVIYYHHQVAYVVPVIGGTPTQIGTMSTSDGEYLIEPGTSRWSPDGNRYSVGRYEESDETPDRNYWSGTSDGAALVALDERNDSVLGDSLLTATHRLVFDRQVGGSTELRMVDLSTIQAPTPTPTPPPSPTPTSIPTPTPVPTSVPTATPTATPAPTQTPSPAPTPTPRPPATPTPTAHPLGCTIFGTSGDDTLVGTPGPDVICGFGGDDILRGRGGDDVLLGGGGADHLIGGGGHDELRGGSGPDRLSGDRGADTLSGGRGPDHLLGRGGPDVLLGNGGADHLEGGPGRDRLRGGPGPDILDGGRGIDDVVARSVRDTIIGR